MSVFYPSSKSRKSYVESKAQDSAQAINPHKESCEPSSSAKQTGSWGLATLQVSLPSSPGGFTVPVDSPQAASSPLLPTHSQTNLQWPMPNQQATGTSHRHHTVLRHLTEEFIWWRTKAGSSKQAVLKQRKLDNISFSTGDAWKLLPLSPRHKVPVQVWCYIGLRNLYLLPNSSHTGCEVLRKLLLLQTNFQFIILAKMGKNCTRSFQIRQSQKESCSQ